MTTTINLHVQERLFQSLETKLGSKKRLIDLLMSTLYLGKSAAYKRINGEILLSIEDLLRLVEINPFSVDEFLLPDYQGISFSGDALRKLPETYEDYLLNVNNNMSRIHRIPGMNTTVLGVEIPPFHYINFPMLYFFKLYYWNMTSWNFSSSDTQFDLAYFEHNQEIQKLSVDVCNVYYSIPSTEIWTDNLFDPIISQIKYFLKLGNFKEPTLALELICQLELLANQIESFCIQEKKVIRDCRTCNETDIQVYYTEIHDGTDGLFFDSPRFNISYIKYDGPNFIKTSQQAFAQYSKTWIEKIKKKSALISGPGEMQRRKYFRKINQKLQVAKEEIEYILKGI